jgi:hypothetical protein
VVNGGGPAPDGNAGCSMNCKGASSETCGGPNRLDVYQYDSSTSSASMQTTSTSILIQPTPTSSFVPPTTTDAGTGKRGIAYSNGNAVGNAQYANLFKGYEKVTWAYDWGYLSHNLDSSFELYVESLFCIPDLNKRANNKAPFQCTDAMGLT